MAISRSSCSAWALISSAVAASSSELAALSWVVWLSCPTAPLICRTPDDCSSDAAAISCTRSEVLRMLGTMASSSRPACSASSTLLDATWPISWAATWLRSASLHLGRHHGETLAVFVRARRFDGRVQRQQIGLIGDVVDDADLLRDLPHRRRRRLDHLAALAGLERGLRGHAVGDLGVLRVLRDRRRHLLDRGAGLLDAGGLLARRLRQRLRRGADFLRGAGQLADHHLHFAHDAAQAARQPYRQHAAQRRDADVEAEDQALGGVGDGGHLRRPGARVAAAQVEQFLVGGGDDAVGVPGGLVELRHAGALVAHGLQLGHAVAVGLGADQELVELRLLLVRHGAAGLVGDNGLVDGGQVGAELGDVVGTAAQHVVFEVVHRVALGDDGRQYGVLAHQRDGFELGPAVVQRGQVGEGRQSQQDHQHDDAAQAQMQPGFHFHPLQHKRLLVDAGTGVVPLWAIKARKFSPKLSAMKMSRKEATQARKNRPGVAAMPHGHIRKMDKTTRRACNGGPYAISAAAAEAAPPAGASTRSSAAISCADTTCCTFSSSTKRSRTLPMPCSSSARTAEPKVGAGSMSAAAMSITALTASTSTPITKASCSRAISSTMMQVRLLTGAGSRSSRRARLSTGTAAPRRLITPLIHGGICGTGVTPLYSMISLTTKIPMANISAPSRKVRYCPVAAASWRGSDIGNALMATP